MAKANTNGFDTNYNMRAYKADVDEFNAKCKENGEIDGSKVVRRMMADYVDGAISYPKPEVKQED